MNGQIGKEAQGSEIARRKVNRSDLAAMKNVVVRAERAFYLFLMFMSFLPKLKEVGKTTELM